MQKTKLFADEMRGLGYKITENVPMSEYTTFKIGGPAEVFWEPCSPAEVVKGLGIACENNVDIHVIGNGSNLLVSDDGVRGVVCMIGPKMSAVDFRGETVVAGAGVTLKELSEAACEKCLDGLVFSSGIPGTLGGAVVMNAGAYEGEMKDVITRVQFATKDGLFWVENADMGFGYRRSRVAEHGVVVAAELKLVLHKTNAEIKKAMHDLAQKREDKQPPQPSAGSYFKRPVGGYASALIDEAGLRGLRQGGAAVSEKHCGFVVNLGGATCADVLALQEKIINAVNEKSGIILEPEVKRL
ncbi:MAG: UDP-N-acetylmuramate dehydrogenase [Clostridia bacterium]|nr:UDP-N-acetylmuramate dehydrogenase [Clostridia bacterium]